MNKNSRVRKRFRGSVLRQAALDSLWNYLRREFNEFGELIFDDETVPFLSSDLMEAFLTAGLFEVMGDYDQCKKEWISIRKVYSHTLGIAVDLSKFELIIRDTKNTWSLPDYRKVLADYAESCAK